MRDSTRFRHDPSDPSCRIPPPFKEERSGGFFGLHPNVEATMKGLFVAVLVGVAAFYAASAAALFGM
ncbi:MAG: hypothetical protein OEW08_09035 [Gammaproteobacteria bacterium]|nr:hypothetical protein [Gammaproteobacteria bacterium]